MIAVFHGLAASNSLQLASKLICFTNALGIILEEVEVVSLDYNLQISHRMSLGCNLEVPAAEVVEGFDSNSAAPRVGSIAVGSGMVGSEGPTGFVKEGRLSTGMVEGL